jgi:hypothetical protein
VSYSAATVMVKSRRGRNPLEAHVPGAMMTELSKVKVGITSFYRDEPHRSYERPSRRASWLSLKAAGLPPSFAFLACFVLRRLSWSRP